MALPTFSQLVKQAQSTTLAYENLKRRFEIFAGYAAELGSKEKSLIPGIVVEPKIEAGHFDVVFAGRRFRFAFKAKIDAAGATTGVILCSEVFQKEAKPVNEFSISENGDTNVSPPDCEGPIGCDVKQGAVYLVLHGIQTGLTK